MEAPVLRDALAKLGCGRTVLSPHWLHALIFALLGFLPEGVVGRLARNELQPVVEERPHGD